MAASGGQPTFPICRNSDADTSKTAIYRLTARPLTLRLFQRDCW